MTEHKPTELAYARTVADNIEGHVVDCSCGQRGELYALAFGARTAYLEHVVEAIATEAGWPETYSIDSDDTYAADAS